MVQWKNFASVTCIQSLYFGEKLSSAIIHLFALSFQTEYCSQIFVSVYYVAFGFVRSLTLPFLSFFFFQWWLNPGQAKIKISIPGVRRRLRDKCYWAGVIGD